MKSLAREFSIGCYDNSCIWGPRAIGTNGGCRCYIDNPDRIKIREGIRLLRQLLELPELMLALKELESKIHERYNDL